MDEILKETCALNNAISYKEYVPQFVYNNLKAGYGKRPYQQDAIGKFVNYYNSYSHSNGPLQLLYHMATGSGKTVIMAALIIYLYNKGYRNFLFFVNSQNILEKTRDNFLNMSSSKYLFAPSINYYGKQVSIHEVENFEVTNSTDINIAFSTVQGLHTKLNTARENSITYEDFKHNKIVLISDEAHHINAETKKGKLDFTDQEESISWEGTITKIFNLNNENILLEFTATADLSNPQIQHKYADKLLFSYPLKQFRLDGYSKEVKVLQTPATEFESALQGIVLSQYRKKIFAKYNLVVKPVILFKSKTISASNAFYNLFVSGIQQLQPLQLDQLFSCKEIKEVFKFLITRKCFN